MSLAVIALMLALSVVPRLGGVARANDLSAGPVYVHFHACPASGPNGMWTDFDYLLSQCDDDAWYVNFSLTTEGIQRQGQWIDGDPRDQVFADVPAHIFSLEGQMSPYGGEPVVYCQGGDGGTSGEYVRMQVHVGDGYTVQPTLGPTGYVVCDWFAAPVNIDAKATASIAIDVHVCPDAFDLVAADHNALPVACKETRNGITFDVESYQNDLHTQSTGDIVNGGVYFQYLFPDFVQITAKEDGYQASRVFCRGEMPESQLSTTEIPAYGDTFAYNLLSEEQLICDWYRSPVNATIEIDLNIRDAQGDAGTDGDETGNATDGGDAAADANHGDVQENAADAGTTDGDDVHGSDSDAGNVGEADQNDAADQGGATVDGANVHTDSEQETDQGVDVAGTGSVLVTVHICPATFDAGAASADVLAGACGGDGNGFAFTLTTEGQSYPQISGQVGNGQVYWDNVPAHIFTLEESIPGGFDAPIVVCDGQRLDASGGAIHPSVSEGATLACDWYNVQV